MNILLLENINTEAFKEKIKKPTKCDTYFTPFIKKRINLQNSQKI